jgi:bifunctional DNase/RNase/predicted DNA-binding protein (UPF0251 family)
MGGLHYDSDPFVDQRPQPEKLAEENELHRHILRATEALSPGDRQAALLFYYEGLSVREAAAVLGISVGAMKVRLHKARSQLRKRLLFTYPELVTKHRSDHMIPVQVAGVISVMQKVQEQEPSPTHRVLLLFDQMERRVLPIWIGLKEGEAIESVLTNTSTPRPMTLNFMASMLQAAGGALEAVEVSVLKDDIYYAVARVRKNGSVREIDARPSDAIGLAIVVNAPIFVAEDILQRTGMVVPENFEKIAKEHKTLEYLCSEQESAEAARTAMCQALEQLIQGK